MAAHQEAARDEAARSALTRRLAAAGCVAAAEEAEALLAAADGPEDLEDRVRRRETGEPLAWVTGATSFAGTTVRVAPGVFVPRPQTEELARRAAARLPAGGRAADLCTGSGAVAVHLREAVPGAMVVGVDLDPRAVRCAAANGVPAVVGDMGTALRSGAFDVVTAVAPYVPTSALELLPSDVRDQEPRWALDGGEEGLELVGRVVGAAARLLRPDGAVLLEVGGDQGRGVELLLASAGFHDVVPWFDEHDDLRGVEATAS